MRLRKWVRRQIEELEDIGRREKIRRWLPQVSFDKHNVCAGENEEPVLLSFGEGDWAENARERMRIFLAENPKALLAYGDEDVIDAEGCRSFWLKPCWSPDSYLCRDYLGSAVAVRKALYDRLEPEESKEEKRCHDRLVELAGGFERGHRTIAHVDGIFFHRKKKWPMPSAEAASVLGRPEAEQAKIPEVSVIIPSKDNAAVLKRCLETLDRTVTSISYEILVVDNGSNEKTRREIAEELRKLKGGRKDGCCLKNTRYLYRPMVFNFSCMCNMGAQEAAGRLLLFLNDDTESVRPGWMERMAEKANRSWVGAVGCKLLYPDGKRIQHAGVANVTAGPTHRLCGLEDGEHYDGRGTGVWNVLAVTGACLMLRREVFAEAGGFCEQMRVAFNDVDLCFKLYELGYHNVVINTVHLLHHESLSRGRDETEEEKQRFAEELGLLFDRHPRLKGRDPYYHPWLTGNVMRPEISPLEAAVRRYGSGKRSLLRR